MNIRYYIDEDTGLPHIWQHGVRESEVADVFLHPGEDRPGRDETRVMTGQTRDGRYLRVIYVMDSAPDSVFVITAYDLTGKPLAAFRRRRRSRNV